jgi:RNA polymerase sigma-70 factor, ECF subfamily
MSARENDLGRGLLALRRAVAEAMAELAGPEVALAGSPGGPATSPVVRRDGVLFAEAVVKTREGSTKAAKAAPPPSDRDLAVSSATDEAEADRLIALVELARAGDAEAFGMLYDHYQGSVYRFLYYRVGSVALAEDLTSETFFRALRSMSSFRWQGKDFGAWLMTIARNLTTDHFKASRTRLESTTEDMSPHDSATDGPEVAVLATLTNEALLAALKKLPPEQQECLIMRFLQGLSIAETAKVLGRSDGAIKQLQLRAVRNLAKLMPEGLR